MSATPITEAKRVEVPPIDGAARARALDADELVDVAAAAAESGEPTPATSEIDVDAADGSCVARWALKAIAVYKAGRDPDAGIRFAQEADQRASRVGPRLGRRLHAWIGHGLWQDIVFILAELGEAFVDEAVLQRAAETRAAIKAYRAKQQMKQNGANADDAPKAQVAA